MSGERVGVRKWGLAGRLYTPATNPCRHFDPARLLSLGGAVTPLPTPLTMTLTRGLHFAAPTVTRAAEVAVERMDDILSGCRSSADGAPLSAAGVHSLASDDADPEIPSVMRTIKLQQALAGFFDWDGHDARLDRFASSFTRMADCKRLKYVQDS